MTITKEQTTCEKSFTGLPEEGVDLEANQKEQKKAKTVKAQKEAAVDDLPGVGAATAQKLMESNYNNLISIAVASARELVNVAGVTDATARKIIQAARSSLDMGFESGEELLARRAKVQRISVGSKAFDDLMGGGFETNCVIECFGPYGSSKTQIAHQLAVNVQKLEKDAITVFIDTENTFRPERIIQFAKGAGIKPENVLKNIKVARAYNSDHQILLAEKVEELINKQKLNVKLLIIDSLTAHFRAEYIGRGTLAERQQKLNKHMRTLGKIADKYNLCVYVTNQVMAKPDQFFGDPTEAIGGHIVGHNSTFRVYLRKGKKGSRVAKLIDAPNLADGEACFVVEEDSIKDF